MISKRFIKRPVIEVRIIEIPYPYIFIDGIPVRINTSISPSTETMIEFRKFMFCFPEAFNIPKDAEAA